MTTPPSKKRKKEVNNAYEPKYSLSINDKEFQWYN